MADRLHWHCGKTVIKAVSYGLERDREILSRAYALGIVDDADSPMDETFRGADLLVLSVPVAQTGNVLKMVMPYLSAEMVVTDTGSTKTDVIAVAREVLAEKIDRFVPAHPIAGREMNGPDAAIDDLFAGKKTVITALSENRKDDIESIAGLPSNVVPLFIICRQMITDSVFATVSHMPHLLAYGLVDYVANHAKSDTLLREARRQADSGILQELPVLPLKCGGISPWPMAPIF